MLSLDCHAHIDPSIGPAELRSLGACVIAVTRSLSEFAKVAHRRDECVTWGLGVHPAIPTNRREFRPEHFRMLLKTTPVVGEIGLDKRSPIDLTSQQHTLEAIFRVLSEQPRILSLHSGGATAPLLDMLETYRPTGVVLHWWRGTIAETDRALDLGCRFSINAAEVFRPKILRILPPERVFTETDHPFGDRHQVAPRRPGRVSVVEAALAEYWNVDVDAVRRQMWRNMLEIADCTGTAHLFPAFFQRSMLAA